MKIEILTAMIPAVYRATLVTLVFSLMVILPMATSQGNSGFLVGPNNECDSGNASSCPATGSFCEAFSPEGTTSADNETTTTITLATTTLGGRCRCDVERNWVMADDKESCYQPSGIGEICTESPESICMVEDSSCQRQSHDPSKRRCACAEGYTQVNLTYCGKILTSDKTEACKDCEGNEGVCYSDGDSVGCKCPASKSGQDCQDLNLIVKCDISKQRLRLCYIPHSSDANYTMTAMGYGNDEECKANLTSQVTQLCSNGGLECEDCPQGSYALELPLDEETRERCGTDSYVSAIGRIRYENEVVVRETDTVSASDRVMRTYCEVSTHSTLTAGYAARGVNDNDRGEYLEPSLKLQVFDRLRREVQSGLAVMIGDSISMEITLDPFDGYAAIRVESCTAANTKNIPSRKADTTHLFENGCPIIGQKIFTYGNMWSRFFGQENVLTTGLFQAFSFPTGNVVYINCRVKLCTRGHEDDCKPKSQEQCVQQTQTRKKRSTDEEVEREANVGGELLVVDPSRKDGFSPGTVAALVVMVMVLAIALVVVSVLLFLRMRRRKKVDDVSPDPGPRPQKFGLARMNPNLRI